MGSAAGSSTFNKAKEGVKSKASYAFLLIPLVVVTVLLWKATHVIAKPDISIYRAAENGDYKDVEAHILTGTPVNGLSVEGHSPLYYAVLSGKADVVELLLHNGASPNAEGNGATNALYTAAGEGNIRIVRDLLAAGADPKANKRTGATPLYAAADSGNPEMVKLFLDLGADPNAHLKNTSGTPLCNACIKGNVECVALLIQHGADVNASGFDEDRPLHYAMQSGKYDVVKLLIDHGANPDLADINSVPPLSTALQKHVDERIDRLLLDHMTKFDVIDYHSCNALHYAAYGGASVQMVKTLLAKGIDPNQVNFQGDTPLSAALFLGRKEIADTLIAGGARVTLRELINRALEPAPSARPSKSGGQSIL